MPDAVTVLKRLEAMRQKLEHRHDECVGKLALELALAMGIEEARATAIGAAAELHDIGKMAIPDAVLRSPSQLSDPEFELMKMHTNFGYELLANDGDPAWVLAASIARSHHEHVDGTGYPDGLAGDQIPTEARLVAIADVYAALREQRGYKPSIPHDQALR